VKSSSEFSRAARLALAAFGLSSAAVAAEVPTEAYRDEPMPPGFRVEATELDGPVFATAEGLTLYEWPQHKHRNGYSADAPGISECRDALITVTAGLMSPYPAGIELPDLDVRLACTEAWPPVLAAEGAEAIGDWTIIERDDGRRQWAYDEQPLYTSHLDERPGDVLGGSTRRYGGDSPAYRVPIKPSPAIPPGFAVRSTSVGRMLTTHLNEALYAYDGDSATETGCAGDCLTYFQPVLAPALARAQGEWSVLERSPGVRQWVYRGEPLYTHMLDQESWSQQGSDVPGWHNVFTQPAPDWPESFRVQATLAGNVLADRHGKTIYVYFCGEDTLDSLACDHPTYTQVYRLAMCGGGDPEKCLEHWPYVEAEDDAETDNRSWNIVTIDPLSGRFAEAGDPRALRVWAWRDRPVYTYGPDLIPGDTHGGGTGEWRGQRNGLRAFWVRDDFMRGILR
jgi:predicted lipoprotein with Yx(FWY)xxD motif